MFIQFLMANESKSKAIDLVYVAGIYEKAIEWM